MLEKKAKTKKKQFNFDSLLAQLSNKNFKQQIKFLCGEQIGEGLYRDVYVLKQNPNYVVKVEADPSRTTFANVTEWRNYIDNKDWKFLALWLASCEAINETGQILIQERVNWNNKKRKDYPKYIPSVFTDLKLKNFGWIGDRFVCCDYSMFVLGEVKMKYAKWWGTLKEKKDD